MSFSAHRSRRNSSEQVTLAHGLRVILVAGSRMEKYGELAELHVARPESIDR
jgi:hypothetical protein